MSGYSIREQGLRSAVALLGADVSPAKNVFRSKLDQITQEQCPCYDVTPGDEKVEEAGKFGDFESVTRTLTVVVRAIMDATTQETGDQDSLSGVDIDDSALDPFYIFGVQQMTGSGGNLGGIVDEVIEVGNATIFQPDGKNLIGLEMTFEFKFATLRGDPTQKG